MQCTVEQIGECKVVVKKIGLIALCLSAPLFARECDIAGDVSHWQMAYCMAKYETDDPGDPGVDACFNTLDKNLKTEMGDQCKIKRYFAISLCMQLMEIYSDVGNMESCIHNPDYTPSIVTNGGI